MSEGFHVNDAQYLKNTTDVKSNPAVEHPPHYNAGKIEVIEFIEDQKFNYHLGSAIKYISRAGKKAADKYVEDLRKAIWYIERQIEIYSDPNPRRPNDMNPRSK